MRRVITFPQLLTMLWVITLIGCTYSGFLGRSSRALNDSMWVYVGEQEHELSGVRHSSSSYSFDHSEKRKNFRQEIDKQTRELGFPSDHIYFLETMLVEHDKGFPQLQFYFAASESLVEPRALFRVYVGDFEVTDNLRFNHVNERNYRIFQVVYYPREFLDPYKSHKYRIALDIEDRPLFVRDLTVKSLISERTKYETVGFEQDSKKDEIIDLKNNTMLPLGKSIDFHEARQNAHHGIQAFEDNYLIAAHSYKMSQKVDELMGNIQYPNNAVMFLWAEPEGVTVNPPVVNFTFAAPLSVGADLKDSYQVILNGVDITENTVFNHQKEMRDRFDLFLIGYRPTEYFDPRKEYTCELLITMFDGAAYRHTVSFTVEEKQTVMIQSCGYPLSRETRLTKRDEIALTLFFVDRLESHPEGFISGHAYMQYKKNLLKGVEERIWNPENWSVEFSDGTVAAKVIEVLGSSIHYVTIKLDRRIPGQSEAIYIKFSPMDGYFTDPCELDVRSPE